MTLFSDWSAQGIEGVSPSGGLEFNDIEFPLVTIEREIINTEIPTPVVMRIYGPVSDPVMVNVSTGETLGFVGNVPQNHYLEIPTEFGEKTITLVSEITGSRADAFHMLNIEQSEFWWLRAGSNRVRMDFSDVGEGGRAQVLWRTRYAGA